jgi:hypothetical protein
MSKYAAVEDVEVNYKSKADAKEFSWLTAETSVTLTGGVTSFSVDTSDTGKVKDAYVDLTLTNKQAKALRKALNEVFGD